MLYSILCVADVILRKLDSNISNTIAIAWKDNTKKTRESQWRQYYNFCGNLELTAVPAFARTVARFLMYKAESSKFSTINNYLSAITVLHKCYGYDPMFRDNFMIILLLDGLRARLGTGVTQKIPLTPEELIKIHRLIPRDDELGQTYWAIVVFCFRTILRKSNVIPESTSLDELLVRRSGISFTKEGMIVKVISTKTIKYRERVLEIPICTIKDSNFCAVNLLRNHFELFPAGEDSPLFLKKVSGNIVPIKYREVLAFLKKYAGLIGKEPSDVGLHSLRRSGTYFMHVLGVPLEDIKCVGDWRSLAALMYLISPLKRKQEIDMLVSSALSKIG